LFIRKWEVEKTLQGLSGIGTYTDNREKEAVSSVFTLVYAEVIGGKISAAATCQSSELSELVSAGNSCFH